MLQLPSYHFWGAHGTSHFDILFKGDELSSPSLISQLLLPLPCPAVVGEGCPERLTALQSSAGSSQVQQEPVGACFWLKGEITSASSTSTENLAFLLPAGRGRNFPWLCFLPSDFPSAPVSHQPGALCWFKALTWELRNVIKLSCKPCMKWVQS